MKLLWLSKSQVLGHQDLLTTWMALCWPSKYLALVWSSIINLWLVYYVVKPVNGSMKLQNKSRMLRRRFWSKRIARHSRATCTSKAICPHSRRYGDSEPAKWEGHVDFCRGTPILCALTFWRGRRAWRLTKWCVFAQLFVHWHFWGSAGTGFGWGY